MRKLMVLFVLASFWATAFVAAHEWKVAPWGCPVGQTVANMKALGYRVGPLQADRIKFQCPDGSHGQVDFQYGVLAFVTLYYPVKAAEWPQVFRNMAQAFHQRYGADDSGAFPKVMKLLAEPGITTPSYFQKKDASVSFYLAWSDPKDNSYLSLMIHWLKESRSFQILVAMQSGTAETGEDG